MATLVSRPFRSLGTMLIDFALPPCRAGCSTVVKQAAVRRRFCATVPLNGMNVAQRRKAVARAFAVADREAVDGRTVVLIDAMFTSGSTAEACAMSLRKADARRIELICRAWVVRPLKLMR